METAFTHTQTFLHACETNMEKISPLALPSDWITFKCFRRTVILLEDDTELDDKKKEGAVSQRIQSNENILLEMCQVGVNAICLTCFFSYSLR